jgi:alkaline phosphatase
MNRSNGDGLSRRDLILSGAMLPLAGGALTMPRMARARDNGPRQGERPQGIILMVSDGMSAGVPALAEPLSQLVRGTGTHWFDLARRSDVARSFLLTESLSSMVTDSAAASSAWGSGSQVFNGSINVLPDGTRLTPIANLAKTHDRAVGLVTTTRVTHATPAGIAAVQPSRDEEDEIATQYVDTVDIVLGGGRKHFDPRQRSDGTDVFGSFRKRGYRVCTQRSELLEVGRADKLVGCFWDDHLPYTVDQLNRPDEHAGVPTLAEMTRIALRSLSRNSGGFLLQIEGGRVDHGAHANDAAGTIWDQIAFDDAIGAVLEFVVQHPDTLVIVTTDHGNANPGLNGMGKKYRDSTECFERLARVHASFEYLYPAMQKILKSNGGLDHGDVAEFVREHTGLALVTREAKAIASVLSGEALDELHCHHRGIVGALGQSVHNHTGIGWTGTAHTNEFALTLAFGPGSEHFDGLMHHTEVFRIFTRLMGIDFENPSMTKREASRFTDAIPATVEPHWV